MNTEGMMLEQIAEAVKAGERMITEVTIQRWDDWDGWGNQDTVEEWVMDSEDTDNHCKHLADIEEIAQQLQC